MTRPLGRNVPPDFTHAEKYPYSAVAFTSTPVIFGVNWYEGFDNPTKGADGRFRVKISGSVRGGHCICSAPSDANEQDAWAYHAFYDQGQEGACEGFGHSRALSLIHQRTFNAFWLYDDAQRAEGTYVPNGGSVDNGSTNRSACAALVKWGDHYEDGPHCLRTPWQRNVPGTGIKSYHWCHTADEVSKALNRTTEVPLLNSWGTSYPETVWVSLEDVDRLLREEGEASVFGL